ncbi:MAG: ABC transporter permease [Lachnospiraceae bacterium]
MLFLAFDNISRRFKTFLGVTLISVIAFILCGMSLYIIFINGSAKQSIENSGFSADEIGYVSYFVPTLNTDDWYEDYEEYAADIDNHAKIRNELNNLDEIKALGWYLLDLNKYKTDKETWSKISREQEEKGRIGGYTPGTVSEGTVEILKISYDLLPIKPLKIKEGAEIRELPGLLEKYDSVIYIGSNVTSVEIGKIIKENYIFDHEITLYVGGRLSQGETWFNPSLDIMCGAFENRDMISLDNMIVEISSFDYYPETATKFYVNAEGYSLNDSQLAISKVLNEHGIESEFGTVSDLLEQRYENEEKGIFDYIMPFSIILIIVAVIILISTVLVDIFLRKGQYGIVYSIGFTKKQVLGSIFIENIIKCIFSYIISEGILYIFLLTLYNVNESVQSKEVFRNVFFLYSSPLLFLVAVLVSLAASVIPVMIMKRKKPAWFFSV